MIIKNRKLLQALSIGGVFICTQTSSFADQQILDDLIVVGSTCVGTDCSNGESFGFDTLRLKENNLRIKFQDTSSTGGFPSADWQLTANDSSNGGDNFFAIDSIDTGKTPFKVMYGADSNALYVSSASNIGFGTSSPVVNLHVVDGNTPALRLEQNGSAGFTAQTWDVAGNEANFFVRDATNGSKLPFRIQPNAPQDSLYINSSGDVGLGTNAPSAALHLRGTAGDTSVKIQEANANRDNTRVLLSLENNGSAKINLVDVSSISPSNWVLATTDGDFVINEKSAEADPELTIEEDGDLVVRGQVTANNILLTSDREKKESFESIDNLSILQKISLLDVLRWKYKTDSEGVYHIGPMAQDFSEIFGLGESDKHISSIDISGVTLSAVKALNELVEKQNLKIVQLEKTLADLDRD